VKDSRNLPVALSKSSFYLVLCHVMSPPLQLDLPPERLSQLKPVTLGKSEDLLVGQRVYAIGG
jgi:hypothetical protein